MQFEYNNPETNNTPESIENPEIHQPGPLRWGTWPTIGFGAAILTIYIMAQNIVALVFAIITTLDAYLSNPQLNILDYIKSLSTNGLLDLHRHLLLRHYRTGLYFPLYQNTPGFQLPGISGIKTHR